MESTSAVEARVGTAPWAVQIFMADLLLSEDESSASGDCVGAPVIKIIGIELIRVELEVAALVCALGIPLAENVAHSAPNEVTVIKAWVR